MIYGTRCGARAACRSSRGDSGAVTAGRGMRAGGPPSRVARAPDTVCSGWCRVRRAGGLQPRLQRRELSRDIQSGVPRPAPPRAHARVSARCAATWLCGDVLRAAGGAATALQPGGSPMQLPHAAQFKADQAQPAEIHAHVDAQERMSVASMGAPMRRVAMHCAHAASWRAHLWRVCACVRARVCVCARACARACVRARTTVPCARVCTGVRLCAHGCARVCARVCVCASALTTGSGSL